jgi:PhnB protein
MSHWRSREDRAIMRGLPRRDAMRFLQIVTALASGNPPPRTASHAATVGARIREAVAAGKLLATGGLGKRATSAARIVRKDGTVTVEDPPLGDGWMAGGGYSLTEYATKEDAIANAKETLEMMGEGILELIQVSEMHPPPKNPGMPFGVVPYLAIEGAGDAAAFYQKAFGAKEIRRELGPDGRKLMHCHLEINGGALMLSDHFPEMGKPPIQRSTSYTMQLVVADGGVWWSRAIAAGCTEKMPFGVAPWGDKYGQLTDPFGVTWAINTPAAK